MPIDTFGFLTLVTAFLNQLPVRDYWAYTGITVDYIQSLFFKIFGNNWYSYVIHSSTINALSALIFYFFLIELKISKFFSLIYALSLQSYYTQLVEHHLHIYMHMFSHLWD